MIVKLGIKKGENIDNFSPKLIRPHNSLLMSIVDNPEKALSNAEGNMVQGKFVHIW